MITKTDWQSVNRELLAEQRRRLGDPPTAEEIEAYTQGKLSPAEEERVRDLLACYPELARTLVAPFPDDEPQPGDPDYATDAQLAQRWEALQQRMGQESAVPRERVVQFPRIVTTLAAALALVFAGLWVRAQSELRRPQVLTPVHLQSSEEGVRGPGVQTTTVRRGDLLLITPRVVNANFTEFEVRIEQNGKLPLWKSGPLPPSDDIGFSVVVPAALLRPDEYEVIVYGINPLPELELERSSLRIEK
jgi:hypothetical protein